MNTFLAQLNQMLASSYEDDWLAGLCDLLRTHTKAHVCIAAGDGKIMYEALPQDGTRPGTNAHNITLPIMGNFSLYLCRDSTPFNEDEIHITNITVSICTLLLRRHELQAQGRRKQRLDSVRAAINALSFSELEAAIHIMRAINGQDGRLVCGHIADKLGFTRSVVVNALKKLEGAGVIETRSLGVKGTHIRIIEPMLVEELNKL